MMGAIKRKKSQQCHKFNKKEENFQEKNIMSMVSVTQH